jgi:hypothetical protein
MYKGTSTNPPDYEESADYSDMSEKDSVPAPQRQPRLNVSAPAPQRKKKWLTVNVPTKQAQPQNPYQPQPAQPPAQPQNPYQPQPAQPQNPYQPQPAQPQNPYQPQPAKWNPDWKFGQNQPQPAQPQNPYQPQPAQPQNLGLRGKVVKRTYNSDDDNDDDAGDRIEKSFRQRYVDSGADDQERDTEIQGLKRKKKTGESDQQSPQNVPLNALRSQQEQLNALRSITAARLATSKNNLRNQDLSARRNEEMRRDAIANDLSKNQSERQQEEWNRQSALRDLQRMEECKRWRVNALENLAKQKLDSDELKVRDIDRLGSVMGQQYRRNASGRLVDAHGKFVKAPVDLYPSVAPPVIIRPTIKSGEVIPGDSLHQNLAAAMRLRGDSESFIRQCQGRGDAIRITPSSYINDKRTEGMTRGNAYYGYVVYLNLVVETSVPCNVRLMHIKGGVGNISRVLTNPINSTSQVVYGRDNAYAFLCEQDTVANGASNKVLLDTGTTKATCLRYNNLAENNKDSENLYIIVCPLNPQDEVVVVVGQATYAVMDVKSMDDLTKNMYASQLFPPIGDKTFTDREWTNIYDPLTKTQAGTLAKQLAGRIAKFEKQDKLPRNRIEQQGKSQRADVFSFIPGYDTVNNTVLGACKVAQPYTDQIVSLWPE